MKSTTNYRPPNPPSNLKAETRKWWAGIAEAYELEPHHIKLLTLAAQAWDRGEAAREVLDREGVTFTNRFGDPTARPEVAVERDSRVAFARLCRELRLDDVAPPDNRPPSLN